MDARFWCSRSITPRGGLASPDFSPKPQLLEELHVREISDLWARLASLRLWSCIGAPYQLGPARRAHRHLPHLQFFNSYAPTENCFVTTCHRLTPAELGHADQLYRVPIGRPVPGWICFLLNGQSAPSKQLQIFHRSIV